MESTFVIVHISDTHVALPGERLSPVLLANRPLPIGGAAGAALSALRQAVVNANGAQSADPKLETALQHALTKTSSALRQTQVRGADGARELDGAALIHTGDLTQAGQIGSMNASMTQFATVFQDMPAFFQIGNHDAWPGDFPPFAPDRIPLQHRWVRGLKTAPPGVSLPERYPNLRFLDAAQTIELVRLNTVLDDSLPNALALGRVAPEYRQELPPGTSRDPFEEIDSRSSGTALRIAAMHHPPYEVDRGFWAAVSHAFVAPSPGGLLDADAVRRELAARDFDLILCGHEHTRAKTQIFEGGRILQLAVGSPAFRKGRGNHDQPHFALYWLDLLDDAIFLWWAVCTIDVLSKESWSVEQAYCFDRSTRRWETTSPSAMPPLLAELVTAI